MIISFITGGGGQLGPTPEIVEKSKRIIPTAEMPEANTVDLGTVMTTSGGAQLNVVITEGEEIALGPAWEEDWSAENPEKRAYEPEESLGTHNCTFQLVGLEEGRAQGLHPIIWTDYYYTGIKTDLHFTVELQYADGNNPDGFVCTFNKDSDGEDSRFFPWDETTFDGEKYSCEEHYLIQGMDYTLSSDVYLETSKPKATITISGPIVDMRYNARNSIYYTAAIESQQWSKLADESYVNNKIDETLGDVEDNLSNI